MNHTTSKDELGPRGFKLIRMTNFSSYDPVTGIEWRPQKESDELFEALKKEFPGRKTHRERMCEALVQFLAEELEGDSRDALLAEKPDVEDEKSVNKSYQDSKRPTFRAQAPNKDQVLLDPVPRKGREVVYTSEIVTKGTDGVKKSGKDWEDMTVVWKSNVGLTKGARPRRMMTEEERTDYRMRRVRGACVSCKRKKRKCNHDPEPSPSSSSDTIGTLPPTPPPRPQRAKPPATRPSAQSPKAMSTSGANPVGTAKLQGTHSSRNQPLKLENTLAGATQSPTVMKRPTELPILTGNAHHITFQYHFAPAQDSTAHYNWDMSGNGVQLPHQEYHESSFHPMPIDVLSADLVFGALPATVWDRDGSGFDGDVSLNLLDPNYDFFMPPSMLPTDVPQTTPLDSVALIQEQRKAHFLPQQGQMPAFAELENHWAQAQGQAHVEQWLDQKAIEECSAPRDPELEVHAEEEQTAMSPQRRRVKFDFSSLIDGPPTPSTPPAEFIRDQDPNTYGRQDQQPVTRPPRSTSRHSTGSRMSFSDINSLSSALTSLSMKDGESRRGSVYSVGSKRILVGDSDEEESEANHNDDNDVSNRSSRTTAIDDDDDAESDDWMRWNMKEQQSALASKEDLLEKYVGIRMQQK